MELKLFGEEVKKLLEQEDKPNVVIKPKEKRLEPTKRVKGKDKATITLSYSNYSTDIPTQNIKKGDRFISVDFEGHNEGSVSPCDTYEEMVKEIQYLKQKHEEKYKIIIIDEEKIQYSGLLDKWKNFIINLCNEKGQEIDKIWFSNSAPYDCEVGLRLKGHRCWSNCVSFRFENYKLKAFDSGFGGGTSFVDVSTALNPNAEQEVVEKVLRQVFNKECEKDYMGFYKIDENKPIEHREINLDDKGWII